MIVVCFFSVGSFLGIDSQGSQCRTRETSGTHPQKSTPRQSFRSRFAVLLFASSTISFNGRLESFWLAHRYTSLVLHRPADLLSMPWSRNIAVAIDLPTRRPVTRS